MLSLDDTTLIQAIHRSGRQWVLALTGGGATVVGDLLAIPGGSASILEAVVPYSWPALIDWLGGKPDHACSARTARAMAMAAFQRARKLADPAVGVENLIGLGCTASLASDLPKRGPHRFHVALQTSAFTDCFSLELEKGARTRLEEEVLLRTFLIHYMAFGCGIDDASPWDLPIAELHSRGEKATQSAQAEWRELLLADVAAIGHVVGGTTDNELTVLRAAESARGPRSILPGAFNPLHVGHREMAAFASRRYGRSTDFELSIINVDKPPMDYVEIETRLRNFSPGDTVWLTRAPTFVEKSRLFPRCMFLVGVDTIVRIAEPKYYNYSEEARNNALAAIAEQGCRFLVFGRKDERGFLELDDVALPARLRQICDAVSVQEFREDISSTELRRQQEQQQQ